MRTLHRNLRQQGVAAGAALLLALVLRPAAAFSQVADSGEMTHAQFRSLVEARLVEASRLAGKSKEKAPPPDLRAASELRAADEVFLQLLVAQARQAAAQQSVDRLSGWSKAIQTRFETQNAPELDVETIRFAEARMAAESARFEQQRRQAAAQANALLGRAPGAPLLALFSATPADPAASAVTQSAANQSSAKPDGDLLAQGRELLAKLYQSYSFGGAPLSALLWQEQEVYKAEWEYRVEMARAAMKPR